MISHSIAVSIAAIRRALEKSFSKESLQQGFLFRQNNRCNRDLRGRIRQPRPVTLWRPVDPTRTRELVSVGMTGLPV